MALLAMRPSACCLRETRLAAVKPKHRLTGQPHRAVRCLHRHAAASPLLSAGGKAHAGADEGGQAGSHDATLVSKPVCRCGPGDNCSSLIRAYPAAHPQHSMPCPFPPHSPST
jgi:hypothetical protein